MSAIPKHNPTEDGQPVLYFPPRLGQQENRDEISKTHPKQNMATVQMEGDGQPIIGQVQLALEAQNEDIIGDKETRKNRWPKTKAGDGTVTASKWENIIEKVQPGRAKLPAVMPVSDKNTSLDVFPAPLAFDQY